MRRQIFLCSLCLALALSCKGQKKTSTNIQQKEIDSVSYEIVEDSVYYPLFQNDYMINHLKINHPDKIVESKLNNSLLNYELELICGEDLDEFSRLENYDEKRLKLKEIIALNMNSAEAAWCACKLIMSEKNILAVEYKRTVYGYPRAYYSHLNLDLETGNILKISDLTNDKTEFVAFLNEQRKSLFKEVLNEQISDCERECITEALANYEYIDYIPDWYFLKRNEEFGIYFNGCSYARNLCDEVNTLNLYISLEEILPYCSKAFRNKITTNFNITQK